jgi:hypothetical protein
VYIAFSPLSVIEPREEETKPIFFVLLFRTRGRKAETVLILPKRLTERLEEMSAGVLREREKG